MEEDYNEWSSADDDISASGMSSTGDDVSLVQSAEVSDSKEDGGG